MKKLKDQWQDLTKKYRNIPDEPLLTASKQKGIKNTTSQIERLQRSINQRIAEIKAARQKEIRLK